MFKFAKKIPEKIRGKKQLRSIVAYSVIVFLIMQCYILPFASNDDAHFEEIATIGDATWTTAVPEQSEPDTSKIDDSDDLSEDESMILNANSDRYRVEPDFSNPFIASAMTIPRGSGMNTVNLCAIYVSKALDGYYGKRAPVAGATLVSEISNGLSNSENWERVFADAACFPKKQTEAQYDAIFDQHTNPGDIVCFVNEKLDNYVHCGIAGGGSSLIGHLTSSGWDSVRACYYIKNAVDTRKKCSGMIVYRYKEEKKKGTIRVCKNYDEDVYKANPQAYDIGGANYAIYSTREDAAQNRNILAYCNIEPGENGMLAGDNVSGYGRTKPDEQGEIVQFDEGVYYIKEFNPPISGAWQLDERIYETHIYAGKRTTYGLPRDRFANPMTLPQTGEFYDTKILGPEVPKKGKLTLRKDVVEEYRSFIEGNSNYTLEGIEYTVYAVSADREINESMPVGVFRMQKDGTGNVNECIYDNSVGTTTMQLPFGWYMVRETKTNSSMLLDMTPQWIHIQDEKEVTVTMKDEPDLFHAQFLLYKAGTDGIPVAGAEYKVCYYDVIQKTDPAASGSQPKRVWMFRTDEKGQIYYSDDKTWFLSGDEIYKNKNSEPVLPAGTVTFQEIKAPDGYLLDETVYTQKIQAGSSQETSADNVLSVKEKQVRGDLSFVKKSEDGTPLANVKFKITDSKGESHIVWTDENGYYSTASSYIAHSKDTNSDDKDSGIWFGNAKIDDTQGALPYGTYEIEELRCDANKNKYRNIKKQTAVIEEHGQTVDLGIFINYEFPIITTSASYKESDLSLSEENQTIVCEDKVCFENLEIGHTYIIEGEVHNQTDEQLLKQNGKKVTGRAEFVATQENMVIPVTYNITFTKELYGTSWVFYETVTDPSYPDETIALHHDIKSLAQTVHFPEPTTETTETTEMTETTEITETTQATTVEGTSTEKTEQPQSPSEVRTGDESRVFLVIMIACTTVLGIVLMLIGKKRTNRKS